MPIRLQYQVMTNHKQVDLSGMVGSLMLITTHAAKTGSAAEQVKEIEWDVEEPPKPSKDDKKGQVEQKLEAALGSLDQSEQLVKEANLKILEMKNQIAQLTCQIGSLNDNHLTPLVSNER